MTKITFHPMVSTVRGKSGGIVFKTVRGKTILAQSPTVAAREASPAQLAQRERFTAACNYAREVLSDPLQRRLYADLARERDRRIDKMIESDFLTSPTVDLVDVANYRGEPGGLVRVLATDDIEVVAVTVEIRTASDAKVESGAAAKVHGVWNYTATATAPQEALVITATARDRPGNTASASVVFGGAAAAST